MKFETIKQVRGSFADSIIRVRRSPTGPVIFEGPRHCWNTQVLLQKRFRSLPNVRIFYEDDDGAQAAAPWHFDAGTGLDSVRVSRATPEQLTEILEYMEQHNELPTTEVNQ